MGREKEDPLEFRSIFLWAACHMRQNDRILLSFSGCFAFSFDTSQKFLYKFLYQTNINEWANFIHFAFTFSSDR